MKKDGKGNKVKVGRVQLTSELMREFWKDPVIREKLMKSRSKKRKISPEAQEKRIKRFKDLAEERRRTGYYEKIKESGAWRKGNHKPEVHSKTRKRLIVSSDPFYLVDGIHKEVEERDRIHTNCGVLIMEDGKSLNV